MAVPGPLTNQKLSDKYLLGDLLGQGGFGAVYRARHLLLNRQQAIKILLEQHFTSPKFRERFTREAQTLAVLDQPNIVHVDDFGFDGSRAYLVMPYIGGGTLHHILRARGALPPAEISRYLEQIAAALDYAHARHVAHLDLKPLNLLVHEDGRLLLSDFGLAHLMEQGAIEGSTSLQFGTPTYMAPEHLQGQPEQRSDIYALGIIVYQMLTGRVPFEGSNAAAIMLKHLTEPPPSLRSVRPDLPPALDAVLNRALAKRAADRYQTAGALLQDFRAAVAGQTIEPTRYSQPLNTTIRATNLPTAGSGPTINPSGVISGPPQYSGGIPSVGFAQPPVYQPVPVAVAVPPQPKPASIWTQGFKAVFGLAVVAGIINMLIFQNQDVIPLFRDFQALNIVLGVICLVGLRYVTSGLMRAGFLLQVASVVCGLIWGQVYLNYFTGSSPDYPSDAIAHLSFALNLFNLASLVCISYTLLRWQPADAGLTALQVIASIVLLITVGHNYFLSDLFGSFTSFEGWGIILCTIFPTALLVFRFPLWKRSPVAVLCLALAQINFILDVFGLVYDSINLRDLIAGALFALGFLVLVQTERVKKQAGVI
jgi:serine/threonine protein kinase